MKEGHKNLVLGALGCGAFHNPPADVAEVLRVALSCYKGCFEQVVIAILGRGDNYTAFESCFNQKLERFPWVGGVHHFVEAEQTLTNVGKLSMAQLSEKSSWRTTILCPYSGKALTRHPERCACAHCSGKSSCGCSNDLFFHPAPCRHFLQCEHWRAGQQSGQESKHFLQTEANLHHVKFYHLASVCTHGTRCPDFSNPVHLQEFSHPFLPPCKNLRLCSGGNTPDHSERFSHICPEGWHCKLIDDEAHCRQWLHPAVKCHKHKQIFLKQVCGCSGHFTQQPAVGYNHQNEKVNFYGNMKFLRELHRPHFAPAEADVEQVAQWLASRCPIHRCGSAVLCSIVMIGSLISMDIIKTLTKGNLDNRLKTMARLVRNHTDARKVVDSHPVNESLCLGFLQRECQMLYLVEKSFTESDAKSKVRHLSEEVTYQRVRLVVGDDAALKLKLVAETVARGCVSLEQANPGIGYGVDEHMDTDKHIFSILGPKHWTSLWANCLALGSASLAPS